MASRPAKSNSELKGFSPREELSFLDLATALYNAPDPFAEPSIQGDGILPPYSGEAVVEVRSPLYEAAIDATTGDLQEEGASKETGEELP
ncbi:UNVERIFIED_CONTAM: hypothetical protein Sindi_0052800 [Sesamum indicum]